jgi:hypothetical protein
MSSLMIVPSLMIQSAISFALAAAYGPGQRSRYSESLQTWTVWGSNPCRCDILRSSPDRPWVPPGFLYNGYRVFFQSSADVKETEEL